MSKALDPFEIAKKVIQPTIPRSDFRVFVLGPGLQPNARVKRPRDRARSHDAISKHARYLRYATTRELTRKDYSVDFGETQQMLDFWYAHFRATNPGSAEMLHASKMCGAVIVYPSSAGSMCELGMFATSDRISEKTLAIVHELYENDNSFFRKALLEVFDQENGKFQFIDYEDDNSCIAAAVKFVDGKYQKLLRDIDIVQQKEHRLRGTYFQTTR